MANLFGGLSEKLNHVFSKLTKHGRLTELEIKQAMREVRIALLEADVNLFVAKDFVNKVSEKALGQEVLKSLSPTQQVIKIVADELTELMGSTNAKLKISDNLPTVIMMCGLQGAGKTTLSGKLALHLKKQNKKPLLVACDIYRPAAIDQLKVVAKNAGVDVYEEGKKNPVEISKNAIEHAKKFGFDTVIIDTAGRLHIDSELMQELVSITENVRVDEILLTVDSMTGQDAVNVAKSFDEQLPITGVVLTKLDGDTRGGACLSVKAVTGKPIKFASVGEKLGDLEPFYPDRMASRILGMGDVLTLIEKAQSAVSEEEMKKMEKKIRDASFTLDDFLIQFENMIKMGSISDILAMMPGMNNLKISEKDIDESRIEKFKAIIRSMTMEERTTPDIIKSSRRKRIADGSGTTIQDVNQLLKQFEQTRDLMKKMKNGSFNFKGGGKRRFPF